MANDTRLGFRLYTVSSTFFPEEKKKWGSSLSVFAWPLLSLTVFTVNRLLPQRSRFEVQAVFLNSDWSSKLTSFTVGGFKFKEYALMHISRLNTLSVPDVRLVWEQRRQNDKSKNKKSIRKACRAVFFSRGPANQTPGIGYAFCDLTILSDVMLKIFYYLTHSLSLTLMSASSKSDFPRNISFRVRGQISPGKQEVKTRCLVICFKYADIYSHLRWQQTGDWKKNHSVSDFDMDNTKRIDHDRTRGCIITMAWAILMFLVCSLINILQCPPLMTA